ncbi:MAG TPA: polyprenyl synthetase family protein [Fimbriimonadaceae bacterium]|nr:polyprenyl synthetase family protein [Fimbriimonadaceae bacterium]
MIAVPGSKEGRDLLSQIAGEIASVEEELARQVVSNVELVQHAGKHTLEAGGKRLRPAFVALAARVIGTEFEPSRIWRIGACMEMIHMATLIHDDVIDHAATRRGKPTASAVYGNTAAIMAGDVLLAKAMVILAQDGDLEIIRTVSQSVVEMAEGEVRELETRGRFELSEEDHLQVLRMKTASFIQCCCEAGALVAGASEQERRALGVYGHHIGMAFQVVDDLLDYRSEATGKPKAGDFREGQATLPLIYLRPHLDQDEADLTRRRFGNGVTDEELRSIVGWMQARGAFDQAERAARRHVELAMDAIGVMRESPEKGLLAQVGDFVLSRQA